MQAKMIIGESKMGQIFDTLKYTKRAMAAGLSQGEAEFHAEELATVINDQLVTKDYLSQELKILDTRINEKMSSLKFDLTWRILGGMSVLLSAFLGISAFILHLYI